MFTKKKTLIVGAACIAVLGVAAFILWGGGTPENPALPQNMGNDPSTAADVGEITPPAGVNPSPVTPVSPPRQTEDVPVLDPDSGDADVVVPFIPEATKPPEAEADANKETHERVEGANPSTPPATELPRQPVTEPPKSSEPKGGDTNSQGQVWFPGFGWVTPGDGNQGERVDSDGDINKQVGDMGPAN